MDGVQQTTKTIVLDPAWWSACEWRTICKLCDFDPGRKEQIVMRIYASELVRGSRDVEVEHVPCACEHREERNVK